MPQETYTREPVLGYVGDLADNTPCEQITRAAAEDINFGDWLVESADGKTVRKPQQNQITLELSGDMATGHSLSGSLKYKSLDDTAFTEKTIGPVPFDTDHDTTMDNLKAELETELADAIDAAADIALTDATNNRVVTITVSDSFEIEVGATAFTVSGGGAPTVDHTRSSVDEVIGLARHQHLEPDDDLESAKYKKGEAAVRVLTKGTVWLKPEDAVDTRSPVYTRFAAGGSANQHRGNTRTTAGTSPAVALQVLNVKFRGSASANGLVKAQINQP